MVHVISVCVCVCVCVSDSHGSAAPDHLAVSAVLCSSGRDAAAGAAAGRWLSHTHGGQVAPGHV